MFQRKLFLPFLCLLFIGCGGESSMSNSAVNTNSAPKITPNKPTPETSATISNTSNMKPANTQYSNTSVIKKDSSSSSNSAIKTPPTPVATPTPATTEKKDEGLFSFPPPRVTSVTEVKTGDLRVNGADTTLAQVSQILAEGLEKAGYKRGKYKYFWNDKEEFAVVTAMERIAGDGSNLPEADRWVEDEHLPKAHSLKEYLNYLIHGKKSFYRVFAFVVSARRDSSEFGDGTPPDFEMAKNWKNKGKSKLGTGGGESGSVENVIFNDKYNCYALVYLFVNHTSLDRTKSVDALDEDQQWLKEELVRDAEAHLEKTNIHFGGR